MSSKQKNKDLLKVKANKFLLMFSYFYLEEQGMTSTLDIISYQIRNSP